MASRNRPFASAEPDVQRLLYISKLTVDASALLTSTVEDILIVSAARNLREGISGFLMCDDETFVQVLEGPAPAIAACYERISRDPRHEDIQLRIRAQAPRMFAQWSMCGLTLSEVDDALLAAPQIGMNLWTVAGGALLQHMESLAARFADRLDARHAALLARDI